jgi:hypothetical protein
MAQNTKRPVILSSSVENLVRVSTDDGQRMTIAHLRDFMAQAKSDGLPDDAQIFLGSISSFTVRYPFKHYLTMTIPSRISRRG